MKKRDTVREKLVAGQPLSRVQRFLCRQAERQVGAEERWFDLTEIRLFSGLERRVEGVVQEMVARGWIEPVASKSKTQRYRMTEAGLRFAAESRHLFKWPAAQSRIKPPPQYLGRVGCLTHLCAELARMDARGMGRELPPYQQSILRSLERGLDEEALAAMHDYWNYNHELIRERRGILRAYRPTPAKPRIDVSVFLSSKGNLIVEWRPAGMEFGKLTRACDWSHWEVEKNRGVDYTSRPSNELMFVHGVSFATGPFPGIYDQRDRVERLMVDAILLQATAAMMEELKQRLDYSFEVRMITDVFAEWEEVENKDWPDGRADVLASWKIENVAERNERMKAEEAERTRLEELGELERFQELYGCTIEVFAEAMTEPDAKKATGRVPSPDTKAERVSRKLKKAGYSKMTLAAVERCRALLERHRPDLLPPPPPAVNAGDQATADIVPFRRPNTTNDPGGNKLE